MQLSSLDAVVVAVAVAVADGFTVRQGEYLMPSAGWVGVESARQKNSEPGSLPFAALEVAEEALADHLKGHFTSTWNTQSKEIL